MASFRFWAVILFLWGFQVIVIPLVPVVGVLADPLFLFLIFLGFHLSSSSSRFLWLYGASLGFLKDLGTAGLFGGFTCTFSLTGWLLEYGRNLVEREDPFVQGVWVGLLVGFNGLAYGFLLVLADPAVGWSRWWWAVVPITMLTSGMCAVYIFPRLRRFFQKAYG